MVKKLAEKYTIQKKPVTCSSGTRITGIFIVNSNKKKGSEMTPFTVVYEILPDDLLYE